MSNLLANITKVFIAADHAGFELKDKLRVKMPGVPFENLGTDGAESVDYPDFAEKLVNAMDEYGIHRSLGILICGSGQGMAIRANRNPETRAALCWSAEVAKLSRQHNNANVLCLPGRFVDAATAEEIVNTFISTPFEGGRHERRLEKLSRPKLASKK